jgi:uncharacterized protein YecE (DUF72 family)
VRHESFDTDEAAGLLREHDVALVVSDGAGTFPLIRRTTASFFYARLHGAEELYGSRYDADGLGRWADEIRSHLAVGRDAFVYFDNDMHGYAPHDAVALRELLSSG